MNSIRSTLSVQVVPGAKRTAIEPLPDGGWKIRLRARAIEGQANAALIEQLAEWLNLSKSRVQLLRGQSGRRKIIAISSPDAQEITRRLESAAKANAG